jgi:hypothetical protein
LAINIYMASYNIQANSVSQSTPKLQRGEIKISTEVAVYFRIGNDPQADNRCAFIPAGETREIRLPTNCLQVAVLAVNTPGSVSIWEVSKAKASCSAKS